MKLLGLVMSAIALVSTVALVGCSSGEGEVAIDAASTALTEQGNDKLFTVRIVDAREAGYGIDAMSVKVLRDGKDALTITCSVVDANTNQKIDKGDKLDCAEGASNELGADLAGNEVDVEVYAKVEGNDTLVGKASWTVASVK